MRKLIFAIGLVVLLAGPSFAQTIRGNTRVYDLDDGSSTSFTITRASTVYTSWFPLNGDYYGLSYRFTSAAGSPNIRIQLQESYRLPDTDNAADTFWTVPDNVSDIATGITTETQHYISFSPVPALYGRLVITEAGVSDDTICTLKVFVIGGAANQR